MANLDITLKVLKKYDVELIDSTLAFVRQLPEKNAQTIFDTKYEKIVLSTPDTKNDRLDSIRSLNSLLISSVSIQVEKIKIELTRSFSDGRIRDEMYDTVRITSENTSLKPDSLYLIEKNAKEYFAWVGRESADIRLQDQAEIKEQALSELRSTFKFMIENLQNETVRMQSANDEYIKTKRDILESEYSKLREDLRSETDRIKEDYSKKNEILEARLKDIDIKESKIARREIYQQMKVKLGNRFKERKLTEATCNLRDPITKIFKTIMWISGILFVISALVPVFSVFFKTFALNNLLLYLFIGKAIFTGAIFLTFSYLYIKWQDNWFAQHSNEEFQLRKFDFDFDRANWIVEMMLEWSIEKDSPIPDLLLKELTQGLFMDGVKSGNGIQHPIGEVLDGVIGKNSKATIDLPSGMKVQIDRNK